MTPLQQTIEDNRKLNEKLISDLVSDGARLGAFAATAARFAEAINAAAGPQDIKARLLVPSEELLTAFEHLRDEIVAACDRLRKAIGESPPGCIEVAAALVTPARRRPGVVAALNQPLDLGGGLGR